MLTLATAHFWPFPNVRFSDESIFLFAAHPTSLLYGLLQSKQKQPASVTAVIPLDEITGNWKGLSRDRMHTLLIHIQYFNAKRV